jgi:hypothetical protein
MKDVEFSNISGIFSPFTTYGELGGGISGILVRKSYQGAYFQSDFGDATVRNFAARNNTRTMNFRNQRQTRVAFLPSRFSQKKPIGIWTATRRQH